MSARGLDKSDGSKIGWYYVQNVQKMSGSLKFSDGLREGFKNKKKCDFFYFPFLEDFYSTLGPVGTWTWTKTE